MGCRCVDRLNIRRAFFFTGTPASWREFKEGETYSMRYSVQDTDPETGLITLVYRENGDVRERPFSETVRPGTWIIRSTDGGFDHVSEDRFRKDYLTLPKEAEE